MASETETRLCQHIDALRVHLAEKHREIRVWQVVAAIEIIPCIVAACVITRG